MIKKLITFFLLASSFILEAHSQNAASERSKSIYAEILGPSNLFGISYDARFTPESHFGYRVGVSYFLSKNDSFFGSDTNNGIFFPLETNVLIGKRKSFLELGLGTSMGLYYERSSYLTLDDQWIENTQKTLGYYLYSNIGYRYQAYNGFQFRAGFSPSFKFKGKHAVTKEPTLYPYLSFGYAF